MKKWIAMLLTLALALSMLAGCGAKTQTPEAPKGGVEGTAAEIIEKIYAQHKPIDLSLVSMDVDLSDPDAVKYMTGLDSAEKIAEAAVSETMLGQPYSLVVVRVKDAADAQAVARQMYEGIDTRKWICVAADTKTAAYSGDVAVFFMVSSDFADCASVETVAEAFQAACGGTADVIG